MTFRLLRNQILPIIFSIFCVKNYEGMFIPQILLQKNQNSFIFLIRFDSILNKSQKKTL